MKKIFIILSLAVITMSCSETTPESEAEKRELLSEYKQQLHDLELQIEALEAELDSSEVEDVVQVEVERLEAGPFEHFFEVTGEVEADLNIDVSPESVGVIDSIFVTEGDQVSKGHLLAKLNTNALQRTLEETQVQYELAQTNFQRQKNLWDQNIGSEMQYLQAQTNMESLEKRIQGIEAQIEMAEIKSPVDGVVDIIYQKKGEIGSPQAPFAKVVNIDDIKIYADVSESFLTKVETGAPVDIFFPALNRDMQARINRVGNTIDPNNRTFRIRIDLNNPDKMIKPNLVSVIKISDYSTDSAIVIPSLYLKEDFVGEYTYVAAIVDDQTVARKVYVETGVSDNNMTEITNGLSEGMEIISEGFGQVADGTVIAY